MRRAFVIGVALAPLAVVASCTSFGAANDAATTPEAGTPDLVADAGSDVIDASADACTALVDDDFTGTTLDPSWVTGATGGPEPTVVDGGGELLLTDLGDSADAVVAWRSATASAGALLRIEVELHVSPIADLTADGIAVAWAPAVESDPNGNFLKTPGFNGNSLGVCRGPTAGLAFGLLTYAETEARHVSILDETTSSIPCEAPIANVDVSEVMPLTVEIRGTSLHANLSGKDITAPLPRATDVAWVGFTAGTGSDTSRQAIAHVHIASCP